MGFSDGFSISERNESTRQYLTEGIKIIAVGKLLLSLAPFQLLPQLFLSLWKVTSIEPDINSSVFAGLSIVYYFLLALRCVGSVCCTGCWQ